MDHSLSILSCLFYRGRSSRTCCAECSRNNVSAFHALLLKKRHENEAGIWLRTHHLTGAVSSMLCYNGEKNASEPHTPPRDMYKFYTYAHPSCFNVMGNACLLCDCESRLSKIEQCSLHSTRGSNDRARGSTNNGRNPVRISCKKKSNFKV